MIILAGLVFIVVGVWVYLAPNDWEEGEVTRYDSHTRRTTLHPAIGGPLAVILGIVFVLLGITSAISDYNQNRAQQQAQEVSSDLSARFRSIMPTLEAHAAAQPGILMTLTPGQRESAQLPDDVMVYYGWCTENPLRPFYVVVQNWSGNDYQNNLASIYGGCGGQPEDFNSTFGSGAPEWFLIREGSFDYNQLMTETPFAATAIYEETMWAQTQAPQPTLTTTPNGG